MDCFTTTTTTTTTYVEHELHKLLPCCTICKAAPRRSDVTNRSTAFARLLLQVYKENERSTKGRNVKRQKTHGQNRRGLRRKNMGSRSTANTLPADTTYLITSSSSTSRHYYFHYRSLILPSLFFHLRLQANQLGPKQTEPPPITHG